MEITIHDSYKLSEIQEDFRKHFPFLKIEFFSFEPGAKKIYSKKHLIKDTLQSLRDIRHIHFAGPISINGHQKVKTLETNFREQYGIEIQVFRKSGDTWLQTSVTDDWTLTEQNKKGEEHDHSSIEKPITEFDEYHEQP